jgi:hypothetical protein
MEHTWVLLVYAVPHEPSAKRVAIWRKLKRLGALLQHDATWILPATVVTREQFQWIAAEIVEMGGSAHVWEARLLLADQNAELAAEFVAQADQAYQAILQDLRLATADRAAMSRRYQQVQARDYFHAPSGVTVRDALTAAIEKGGSL